MRVDMEWLEKITDNAPQFDLKTFVFEIKTVYDMKRAMGVIEHE